MLILKCLVGWNSVDGNSNYIQINIKNKKVFPREKGEGLRNIQNYSALASTEQTGFYP